MKRTSQVTSPRHPSIAAIRMLSRTVGIGVYRSAIWSFACLIALAGASLFAFGAPARAADSNSRATNLVRATNLEHPGNAQFAKGYILVGPFAGTPDVLED